MAAKKNKAKILSKKEAIGRWQWLNLPEEVIQLIRRIKRIRSSPLHYVSTIGTTKSWVTTTSRCNRSGERRWPELYLLGNSSNNSPASTRQEYFACDYSIPNASTDCRQIMVYRPDERMWIRYEFTTIDSFDAKKKCIEFTSIIGFQRKLYALSLQGTLAVIEDIDSRPTITATSSNRAVPSVSSRFFKEYLVELDGEIFLVFFIHQKSLEIVDQVEVFRLCFLKLKWIKVERLQGKALFLDRRCSWVNSAEIGCRGDCVYFTQGSDNGWWIYDMENCCISQNKTSLG